MIQAPLPSAQMISGVISSSFLHLRQLLYELDNAGDGIDCCRDLTTVYQRNWVHADPERSSWRSERKTSPAVFDVWIDPDLANDPIDVSRRCRPDIRPLTK